MILGINNHVFSDLLKISITFDSNKWPTKASWFQPTGKRGKSASLPNAYSLTTRLVLYPVSSQLHLAVKVACTTPSYQCKQRSQISHANGDLCWDWFLCVNMTVTCVGQSAKTHAKDMRTCSQWSLGTRLAYHKVSLFIWDCRASCSLANVETKGKLMIILLCDCWQKVAESLW